MRLHLGALVPLLLTAAGCNKSPASDPTPAASAPTRPGSPSEPTHAGAQQQPPATSTGADHGVPTPLGSTELAGFRFELTARGRVVPGQELAVTAKVTGGATPDAWRQLQVFVGLETTEGTSASRPGRALEEAGELHIHTTVLASGEVPARVVLRVRQGDQDQRARLPLPVAIVQEIPSRHEGMVARLENTQGALVGYAEVKLHDDKGDLEVWLTALDGKPLDLPVTAGVELTFAAPAGPAVGQPGTGAVLIAAPRDPATNPDEDGTPNVRNGGTNYFIYPGETGADASWLMGAAFHSQVTVSVKRGEGHLTTPMFLLVPHGLPGHTHGPGGHAH